MDMTEFNTPGSETASIKREDSPLNQEENATHFYNID